MQIIPNTIITEITASEKIQADRKQGSVYPNNFGQESFKAVLENKISEAKPLQFSKHANIRLNSRDISLTAEQLQRVEDGISMAKAKGVTDSLVIVDNVALVVNVKNATVITAMNQNSKNVFTNINGAVFV